MAGVAGMRRRLLLSIIRAPTLSQHQLPLAPSATARSIHNAPTARKQGFSISFGEEIDSIMQPNINKSRKKSLDVEKKGKHASRTKRSNTAYATTVISKPNQGQPSLVTRSDTTSRQKANVSVRYENHKELSALPSRAFHKRLPSTHTVKTRDPHTSHQRIESPKAEPGTAASTVQWKKNLEPWQIQKAALQDKFGEDGWNPRKKLSPDAIEGIRSLHEQDPNRYTTPILSQQFKVSPEAIRRILKSKWRASSEEMEDRRQRWARRHDRIWDQKVELGLRRPRTRDRDPEGPEAFEEEVRAKQMLGQL